jgi:arsenate reductase (glutaredoxin)
MTDRIYNVLFLCTGNSARSILAESLLNRDGEGRFRAFSAGSHPKGAVHPLALKVLDSFGYPTEGARSKSWDEFATADAPVMDFVFTVCDNAAGEVCPFWPGQPVTAHWGIEDPASVEGTEWERERAFVEAFRLLKNRISVFAALPISKLDRLALTREVEIIGKSEGATGLVKNATIYHNPDCGTSRNTLALLREADPDVRVIEYLHAVPSKDRLQSLIARAGLSVRDVLRKKGTPYKDLGLDDATLSDQALLDAMLAHPILINRPIVETARGVALCRPSDVVVDLVPPDFYSGLVKEEGAPFLRDRSITGSDPTLVAALTTAKLPTSDVTEAGRSFFAYSTLAGEAVGFGGYELYGQDVLLRSIVVPEAQRSHRIGRNLVPLLLYRAFQKGARKAWVLTTTAEPFFSKIGFKVTERSTAPETILSTRQAKELCPSTAILLSRSIGF